jgi:hypothetical protein
MKGELCLYAISQILDADNLYIYKPKIHQVFDGLGKSRATVRREVS